MKLVYICSPYAGDIDQNICFTKAACRYAANQGCAPVAPHLLYPQFLNDAVLAERESVIRMGLRMLYACDELWICGPKISAGMEKEIAEAGRLGIPVSKMPSVFCLNDQDGNCMDLNDNLSGTLQSQEHGHTPLIMGDKPELLKETPYS